MKLSRSNIIVFRISLAAALSGILILATTPHSYPVVSDMNDKFNHVLAFFILALLADFSFPEKKSTLAMVLPLLAYGMAIEIIQYFLPYRMFSLFDVTADAVGIGLYKISFSLLKKGLDGVINKKEPL